MSRSIVGDRRSKGNPSDDPLNGSELSFRLLVDGVVDHAIYMLDPEGYLSSWNAGAARIKGYSASEILGRHFSIFYTKEDRENGTPAQALATAQSTGRYIAEGFRVRKDGSQFRASVTIEPIRNKQGTLLGFAKITHDITERQQAEAARLNERFRRVVEAAPNAMILTNPDGLMEMVNTQTESMFGYVRTELLGQSVDCLVPERFRANHPGLRTGFHTNPTSRSMGAGRDLYGLRKDGTEFPVEIGINPIETAEGMMVLAAVVDISDRKNKEEKIQAALKEKNILLGEIHHRVKNNLNIVYSLLDLQSANVKDKTVVNMLRDSQNRVKSMAMIHQTLYLSNDFARVDFKTFLDALCPALIASYAMSPEVISLSVSAANTHLPIDSAIPCGLIVNELISNALKHAFPAKRRGEISVTMAVGSDGQVYLSVADDGIGIDQHLDIERTNTLGLQLVTLLTDQLAGKLEINRANPTRFALTFPLQR
jgi:PAS domain S-box-containing protein